MIISYLCDYYKDLSKNGKIIQEGYDLIEPKFLVSLSIDGKILNISFLGEPINDDKKIIYTFKKELIPLRSQKSAIDANIVEHRPLYLFGLEFDKNKNILFESSKSLKSHEDFKNKTLDFFKDLDSKISKAFYNFALNWNPLSEKENKLLLSIGKDYNSAGFIFCLENDIQNKLNQDQIVKEKWNLIYQEKIQNMLATELNQGQCAIYGEKLPIAKLHNKIKHLNGGMATGNVMVCINNPSEESYGKEQANNSSISQKAMREYTEALNYLLSSGINKQMIDEMTIVHFALNSKLDEEVNFVNNFGFEFFNNNDALELTEGLSESLKKIKNGEMINFKGYESCDDSIKYIIFGLVPNSSRIAIKFFYQNTFGKIKDNILKYHEDFSIENSLIAPSIKLIRNELVSPKANEEVPPDIGECLIRSMLEGKPFPFKLLQLIIKRIKTDSDEEKNHNIKMNNVRIALLKACLIRTYKEDITLSLDEKNNNSAYLCGRLFAILEKIQLDSTNGNLNRTIKDSFFASTMTNPAVNFARLIKLSKNHLAKLGEGKQVYYTKLEAEIMDKLNEFPKTLTLFEQGNFILGYYQQNKKLYSKKIDNMEEL